MDFEKTMQGIIAYIDKEILVRMNTLQEIVARIAISRVYDNRGNVKHSLMTNPVLKTFAFVDEEGNVDVVGITNDLKKQIARKGKLEFEIPMFGKFSFVESDVDVLHRYIMEA